MARELFVVGISWRTAPVAVREKLAIKDGQVAGALAQLVTSPAIDEAVILSTCNRVEVYGAAPKAAPRSAVDTAASEVRHFLSSSADITAESLASMLYEHNADAAVSHIFRVASALDSMVVGETQILGQLKDAYGLASQQRTARAALARCLERSFSVAKRVRSETGISRGAANVSSVAVELARRVFGDLGGKSVLVIGAGKMSALAARHLRSSGTGTLYVTNRSRARADELAAEIEGAARDFDSLPQLLAAADVIITSTGSSEPIIDKKLCKKAMRARRYKPIVIVDIAVPRDVHPAAGDVEGVYLFDIDDLERVVAENLQERAREADEATEIVTAEVSKFVSWMSTQRVVPTIRSLREHFSEVASAEVDKALRALGQQPSREEAERALRGSGERIVRRLLHKPMMFLKNGQASSDGDGDKVLELTRQLFELELSADEDDDNVADAAALKPDEKEA